MNRNQLIARITEKKNYLCLGLDTDIDKIPRHLLGFSDPVFEFNKAIIDATKNYCVSYKINTAFYEANGLKGWEALQKTIDYIPSTHFTIADAKRGDIGNTSAQYAKAFFETYGFDAITVAPYMGEDSLKPFLEYKDKWTIVLGLTSNMGSADFEQQQLLRGQYLFEEVMDKTATWGTPGNLMFVVGATKSDQFSAIRKKFPDHFFLVPGVGAQGGNLSDVSNAALTHYGGLLINVSRAVIFASSGEDFVQAASIAAKTYADEMKQCFENKGF